MTALTPWEDVVAHLLTQVSALEVVTCDLSDALRRAVVEDIVAPRDVPAFANSAMDGFAVRARDLSDAGPQVLRVVGEVPAGVRSSVSVGAEECARIMTGAMVPVGADAVVPVEDARSWEDHSGVFIETETRPGVGQFVRGPGSDTPAGTVVMQAGDAIHAAHLGMLHSLGISRVAVRRRVRVGICSTGDELVSDPDDIAGASIADVNRPMLHALLEELGCEITDYGIVRDHPAAVDALLDAAARACDVLITSGGVSMGDHDEMKFALERRGILEWHHIAIRPGKPLATARIGDLQVIALPGNPVSARVSFELFARPVLRALGGHRELHASRGWAVTDSDWARSHDGKVHLDRVTLRWTSGRLVASRVGVQASHVLRGLAQAHALAMIPNGDGLPAGAPIEVLFLESAWA